MERAKNVCVRGNYEYEGNTQFVMCEAGRLRECPYYSEFLNRQRDCVLFDSIGLEKIL